MSKRNAQGLSAVIWTACLSAALLGCTTSTREAGPTDEPPAAEVAEPGAPSEPAAPSPSAAPSEPPAAPTPAAPPPSEPTPSEPAAPSAAKPAAAKPEPDEGAAPDKPAPAPAAATGACGEDGQPMCPLQAFMEKEVQAPLDAGDFQAVSKALLRVAKLAPNPAWNASKPSWAVIANEGATAAASADPDETGASCKGCHKAFRKQYKAEHRTRPLP